MKYIKQLDSLRAVAVILVVISHWVPTSNILNYLPNGEIGVDMFFVLSGFLITTILINQREENNSYKVSKRRIIVNFYVRRSLRIFPIYYLVVLFLYFISSIVQANVLSAFPYLITYSSNFYFFKIQKFDAEISHLWSLAVEEQFYLIWPWLILFSKKKNLLYIIVIFILIGVFGQMLTANIGMKSLLTFNCFDAFGLGALFSYFYTTQKDKLEEFYKVVAGLAIISLFLFLYGLFQHKSIFLPQRTFISIITLFVITYIVRFDESISIIFKYILNNRVLIFLGKISYGIYLYHNFIPTLLNSKLINIYINPLLPDLLYKQYWGYLFLFENIVLLILISWLSFILIEKRFLNLKKYFVYK